MKLILSVLLFCFSIPAFSFTLNSSSNPNFKGWSSKDIDFAINTTNCPANVQGMMDTVFDIWRNVAGTNVELKLTGTTSSTTYANPITIYCETNFNAITGADENSVPGVGGLTPAGADHPTGGVLILNVSAGTGNINNYNSTSLKIILAHEVGHVLGLGHSEDSSALMYYDASAKDTFSLAQDDIDGLSYLYPRNELGKDGLMGCGMIKARNFPNNKSGPLWTLMFLLPLLFGLWLRMRSASPKSLRT